MLRQPRIPPGRPPGLAEVVERGRIACPGRFIGAHRPGHYETLARDFETLRREVGLDCHSVPRAEQHGEIGSDIYYGGGVVAGHMALHPALYHRLRDQLAH